MRLASIALILAAAFTAGCSQETRRVADRDNTAVNDRDRPNNTPTPMDQSLSAGDVKITAEVRQRILKEDVSVNARNVKVITRDGAVVLRGPVKSQAEKDLVEKIAHNVAGVSSVDNQIEVEANP